MKYDNLIKIPLCLAIGVNWCAVYSDNMNLRIFSLSGVQKIILCMCQVIAMCGYENYLAVVYHTSPPLFSTQILRFKIIDVSNYSQIIDCVLPLSSFSTLVWFGYSEGKSN